MGRPAPTITSLPVIPAASAWVYPRRRKLRHVRQLHIAHRSVDVTLCGRVRPGAEASCLPEGFILCQRCVYRAGVLWIRI